MTAIQASETLSPCQYLEWELQQPVRHEFVGGKIYAMTGASAAHNTIAVNVAGELRMHLRAGPCRVFTSDMKVQVAEEGPFFYPDVAVTCDERDNDAIYTIQHPSLIVEVLSPSTGEFDRSGKFVQYRRLRSLQEYVLIDAQQIGVERFRRTVESESTWILQIYGPGTTIELSSVGLQLPIDTVYEKVRL